MPATARVVQQDSGSGFQGALCLSILGLKGSPDVPSTTFPKSRKMLTPKSMEGQISKRWSVRTMECHAAMNRKPDTQAAYGVVLFIQNVQIGKSMETES